MTTVECAERQVDLLVFFLRDDRDAQLTVPPSPGPEAAGETAQVDAAGCATDVR